MLPPKYQGLNKASKIEWILQRWGTLGQWSSTRGSFITWQTLFYNVYRNFWLPWGSHIEMPGIQLNTLRCVDCPETHTHTAARAKSSLNPSTELQERRYEQWCENTLGYELWKILCAEGWWGKRNLRRLSGIPRHKHKHAMSGKPCDAEHFSRWGLKIKRRLSCIWPFYYILLQSKRDLRQLELTVWGPWWPWGLQCKGSDKSKGSLWRLCSLKKKKRQ